jgi:hypothetical protein
VRNCIARLRIIALLVFGVSALLLTTLYCVGAEAADGTGKAEKIQRTDELGARRTKFAEATNEVQEKKLERRTRRALGSYHDKVCAEVGLVRYHGKCIKPEERSFLFETEIRHVESLLNEAIRLYQIATPEEIAFSFNHADRFIDKFEFDEVIDERMAKKIILLLGYIFIPAEKWDRELRQTLQEKPVPTDPMAFLTQQKRMESFSRQVYVPLMTRLAEQMAEYESQYGKEDFRRFMRDNGLEDILADLEHPRGQN